jgi:hypothetical protein
MAAEDCTATRRTATQTPPSTNSPLPYGQVPARQAVHHACAKGGDRMPIKTDLKAGLKAERVEQSPGSS